MEEMNMTIPSYNKWRENGYEWNNTGGTYFNRTYPVVNLIPDKQMDKKFKLELSEKLLQRINYLCSTFSTKEWSGALFYNIVEGDINDIENLKLEATDLYVMDLGNQVFTEFSHSPEFAGYMARHPELMDGQVGWIHSHNNMQVFFSGTDTSALREFAPIYKKGLSVVINNRGDAVGKLAVYAKASSPVYTFEGFDFNSKSFSAGDKEDEIALVFDAVISKNGMVMDSDFLDSIEVLKTKPESVWVNPLAVPAQGTLFPAENYTRTGREPWEKPDTTLPKRNDNVELYFACAMASQNYFYSEVQLHKDFTSNITKALSCVPKALDNDTYRDMVYKIIEPLFSYFNIELEEEQGEIIENLIKKLEPLKDKSQRYKILFDVLTEYYEYYNFGEEEDLPENKVTLDDKDEMDKAWEEMYR